MQKYKRRLGDRYDGRRVRGMDPIFKLIPNVMRSRLDCQVHFEDKIDLEPLEKFVHAKRREDFPTLSVMNVLIAAVVRTLSQRPNLNRFVAGNKIYARNSIAVSMAIKKEMPTHGEETTITPHFDPEDTLYEVTEKINKILAENKTKEAENKTDVTAKIIAKCPNFVIRWLVTWMRNLDKIGMMPKFFYEVSPFHCSVFITDVGSIGIGPVYHHLYEFGTCSVFLSIGKKEKMLALDDEKNVVQKRYIGIRFVIDERITDGFYNAGSIKVLLRHLRNPEMLLTPPEQVIEDDMR